MVKLITLWACTTHRLIFPHGLCSQRFTRTEQGQVSYFSTVAKDLCGSTETAFLTCNFFTLTCSHLPSLPPSLPPSPRSDCFNKQPAHFNANLICFPKRHRVSIFSSPFHACYLQQWWCWTCFFEWRLLVPAQLFSDEADFSHIGEVLGRNSTLWLNSCRGQDSREEKERCLLVMDSPKAPVILQQNPVTTETTLLSAQRCQRQDLSASCAHFVCKREWREAEDMACFTQEKQTVNCGWVILSTCLLQLSSMNTRTLGKTLKYDCPILYVDQVMHTAVNWFHQCYAVVAMLEIAKTLKKNLQLSSEQASLLIPTYTTQLCNAFAHNMTVAKRYLPLSKCIQTYYVTGLIKLLIKLRDVGQPRQYYLFR